ncbi:ankyrin repeat-containing protein At5g02620 [Spinacia oleracea]|uniref:Ankyrin repeat-containing protein At5g02620 n=1 Tax=Spinacia oleracea TaxID=3562 RepID=A0A9R0JBG6_SPIOL|nr:ankyrin repeat-containing protein At5g02620-like [Spinacia oleracea]
MEMDKRLYEASLEGNVSILKALIQEDPLILDRISPTFFQDTPLHIATLRGHFEFARAVLGHNHRLATEADSLGHLPLHVASAKGHVEIVRELLRVGPAGSCLARSKDGKLPLHLAIMKGVRVEVLTELARASPESTRLRVDKGDYVLHLCVKYDNLDAFQLLVDLLKKESDDNNLLINARNDDGNTILHLAALHKNLEITKYLVATPGIELNAVNNNGLTALDLLENSPKDVKGLELLNFFLLQPNLQQPSTNTNNHSSIPPSKLTIQQHKPTTTTTTTTRRKKSPWKRFFTFNDNNTKHLEDMKGAILLTAAIIVTINALPIIYLNVNGPDIPDQFSINSGSFVPAVMIIVLLVSGIPLNNKFCAWLVIQLMYSAIGFMGLNYIGQMISTESRYSKLDIALILTYIWFLLLIIVSALNIIRLVVYGVTSIKRFVKRRKLRGRRENNDFSIA